MSCDLGGRYIENLRNVITSRNRLWSDLHEIWYADTSCLRNLQNVSKSKPEVNSAWWRWPYWISVADHPILTKFGVPTQILTPPSKIYQKFEFFRIQDGAWKPS